MSRPASAIAALLMALALTFTLLGASPAYAKKRTRGHVSYGDTTYRASNTNPYEVTGRVSGGRDRPVLLQVRWADGWHRIDRTSTVRRGRFELTGRFNWYGTHRLRVRVPASASHRARNFRTEEFRVRRGWRARGERSKHGFFHGEDKKFAWNPCNTISYRVNPGGYGRRTVRFTKQAVERLRRATGFRLRYVGTTRQVPFRERDYPHGTDLIVAWSNQERDPALAGAVGIGGFRNGYLARRRASGQELWAIQQPGVTMNMTYRNTFPWSFNDPDTEPMGLVLIHELAHAVGLTHVSDDIQIMHTDSDGANRPPRPDGKYHALWEKGDLAGLRKNGAGPGCTRPVPGRAQDGSTVTVPGRRSEWPATGRTGMPPAPFAGSSGSTSRERATPSWRRSTGSMPQRW